jgi:predicted CXXCH cytochrome family protein
VGAIVVGSVACDDEEPAEPNPPGATQVTATTNVDTVSLSWTAVTGAASYRAELDDGVNTLTKSGSDIEAEFTSADGIEDDVTYTATVYAINTDGETESSNSPTVLTNFFMWDEHFVTALHATGRGMETFYEEANGGFERFTNVAYADLACKSCHEPASTGGCASCHDSDSPGLGATVDASLDGVCGPCHGRQRAEVAQGYSDVHRDAGFDCMECHTMEDVHGDGTAYASMLEPGAIDADCGDCHTSVPSNAYHDTHATTVDCSACHMQSVVSCNNCHFEAEIAGEGKIAYGQFKDWVFLMNYDDGTGSKVYGANYQSVKYGDNTLVAFAPFYAHTIARNAVTCGSCHGNMGNQNVQDYFANGSIDVVTWDPVSETLSHATDRVPVPPDFLTTMDFDFVTLDSVVNDTKYWSFLKAGADTIQIVYGSALTADQMNKLQ